MSTPFVAEFGCFYVSSLGLLCYRSVCCSCFSVSVSVRCSVFCCGVVSRVVLIVLCCCVFLIKSAFSRVFYYFSSSCATNQQGMRMQCVHHAIYTTYSYRGRDSCRSMCVRKRCISHNYLDRYFESVISISSSK